MLDESLPSLLIPGWTDRNLLAVQEYERVILQGSDKVQIDQKALVAANESGVNLLFHFIKPAHHRPDLANLMDVQRAFVTLDVLDLAKRNLNDSTP